MSMFKAYLKVKLEAYVTEMSVLMGNCPGQVAKMRQEEGGSRIRYLDNL